MDAPSPYRVLHKRIFLLLASIEKTYNSTTVGKDSCRWKEIKKKRKEKEDGDECESGPWKVILWTVNRNSKRPPRRHSNNNHGEEKYICLRLPSFYANHALYIIKRSEREKRKSPRGSMNASVGKEIWEREVYILSFLFVTRNALSRNVIVRDPWRRKRELEYSRPFLS